MNKVLGCFISICSISVQCLYSLNLVCPTFNGISKHQWYVKISMICQIRKSMSKVLIYQWLYQIKKGTLSVKISMVCQINKGVSSIKISKVCLDNNGMSRYQGYVKFARVCQNNNGLSN